MKILVRSISLLLLTLSFPLTTFAWNALGHMVIANIAYQHLTPVAREKVDNMVAFLHTEYPEMGTYEAIATWPDGLRSQKIETYSHWHYIDYSFSLDGTPLKNVMDTDNAVWALNNIKSVVKNSQTNPYERARFLAFLTHIVGDLHQPLHTVSYFSAKTPDGDKGGNSFYIMYKNSRVNLHKVWDEGVGSLEGTTSSKHIDAVTAEVVAQYPESYFGKQINDFNFNDWTTEGMNHSKQSVYTTPAEQAPSAAYLENGKKIAEQRVALAGYRLAELVNQLLA